MSAIAYQRRQRGPVSIIASGASGATLVLASTLMLHVLVTRTEGTAGHFSSPAIVVASLDARHE